jgi:hypothetical protein
MRLLRALPLAVVSLLISAAAPECEARPCDAANGTATDVAFVPWKIHRAGDAPPVSPLVLYWVPASADDFRHSDLLTSRALASYTAQCIALEVVTSDDAAMLAKLAIDGPLPAAVLVDAWGIVAGRVVGSKGLLRASDVEKMMRDAMRAREESLNDGLDDAPKKISAGDRELAVAIYRRVWMQRCVFPRQGREAERAMKKLGVDVVAER